jgi:hypothetical protein
MRMACNANPAGGHYQELTTLQFVRVFLKHGVEVFNFGLQGSSWKPKEDDTGSACRCGASGAAARHAPLTLPLP